MVNFADQTPAVANIPITSDITTMLSANFNSGATNILNGAEIVGRDEEDSITVNFNTILPSGSSPTFSLVLKHNETYLLTRTVASETCDATNCVFKLPANLEQGNYSGFILQNGVGYLRNSPINLRRPIFFQDASNLIHSSFYGGNIFNIIPKNAYTTTDIKPNFVVGGIKALIDSSVPYKLFTPKILKFNLFKNKYLLTHEELSHDITKYDADSGLDNYLIDNTYTAASLATTYAVIFSG